MTIAQGMQVNLFASEERVPKTGQSGSDGGRYRQSTLGLGVAVVSPLESDPAPPRRFGHLAG